MILELKERAQVYIPLDDEIDTRLGEFINSSNDPAKLTKLFLREGEGVYSFGTKRVYVKMENGKIFSKIFKPKNYSPCWRRIPWFGTILEGSL